MKASYRARQIAAVLLIALLAGCSTTGKRRGGGYYQDDGPDAHPPSNLDSIPDAVPRIEPYASGANKPYVVFGKRYVPDTTGQPYKVHGVASWYGRKFHGNSTSIGEKYDMYSMTAAHTTLPIPSYARVTSGINGRSIIVRVNDRGPFHDDRVMDLSYVAAYKLGIIGPGSGEVTVQALTPNDIRHMAPGDVPPPEPASAIASRGLPENEAYAAPAAMAASGMRQTGGSALAQLPESEGSAAYEPASSFTPRPLPPPPNSGGGYPASERESRDPVGAIAMGGALHEVAAPASGGQARYAPAPAQAQPAYAPPASTAYAPMAPAAPASRAPMAPPAAASYAPMAAPAASSAGGIYVQFGAFGAQANAQSLAARLGRQLDGTGMPPAAIEQAGNLYKVSIGPYRDRQAAQQALETAATRTGLAPTLISR
jgi:rare lipoprotein A